MPREQHHSEFEHKQLTKYAGKTAFGTFLSRILGYIRDMLVADMFGVGMFADVFYAAFRIPNLFRRLFGEGSFSAAFIPVFSKSLQTQEKSETQKLLNAVFTALFSVLIIVTILGIFASPLLVRLIAWGYTGEKLSLTIELTRWMFPFIVFISLAAFLLAILNSLRSFFLPAFAPSALSMAEIFYVLALAPAILSDGNRIVGLAVSVVVGGALHFIIQYPALKLLGWQLKLKLKINYNGEEIPFYQHPGIRRIVILMIPAMIGLSVDQINSFVDSICASFLPTGAMSALYYSNRVMQLPLAIFGLAFASVSLPAMSKAFAQNDMKTLKSSLNHSVRFSVFTLVPAAVGLIVIGMPITRLLFERGHFNEHASQITNFALTFYSVGLPAYAVAKIFANAFYSFQDTKTPVFTAMWAMILHVVLCVIVMLWTNMGVGGLALSTAISSYFNVALLSWILRKRIGKLGLKKIVYSTMKSLIASAATGVTAVLVVSSVHRSLFVSVPAAIAAGAIVFFAVAKLLNSEEVQVSINIIKGIKGVKAFNEK